MRERQEETAPTSVSTKPTPEQLAEVMIAEGFRQIDGKGELSPPLSFYLIPESVLVEEKS